MLFANATIVLLEGLYREEQSHCLAKRLKTKQIYKCLSEELKNGQTKQPSWPSALLLPSRSVGQADSDTSFRV